MGKYYQQLDAPHFDYDLQAVGKLPRPDFRGPAVDRTKPYIACIGAAQMFGRFVERPMTALLAERLGVQVLNLGIGGAGPRLFASPHYLELVNGAELVVVQVLAGRSEGNSRFDNSKSGRIWGTRVSDKKEMRFEQFLTELVETESTEVVKSVVQETRDNYVRSYAALREKIERPAVLLWWSHRTPEYEADYTSAGILLNRFPQLIDRATLDRVREGFDGFVECVSARGTPQIVWPGTEPVAGAEVENGNVVNRYYPTPEMHEDAVEALLPACESILQPDRKRLGSPQRAKGKAVGEKSEISQFVVLCAERTGSNLLCGMLDSHSGVAVGGELFNSYNLENDKIPWPRPLGDEILALRKDNPGQFLQALFSDAAASGHGCAGFKLTYGQGDTFDLGRRYLESNKKIRVLHLKRKNLLRRLLSEERARKSGVWAVKSGGVVPEPGPVELSFDLCVRNFRRIECQQTQYAARFAEHQVLDIWYEDMVEDMLGTCSRVFEFLGIGPVRDVQVLYAKTGTSKLEDGLVDSVGLRSEFERWLGFFDD